MFHKKMRRSNSLRKSTRNRRKSTRNRRKNIRKSRLHGGMKGQLNDSPKGQSNDSPNDSSKNRRRTHFMHVPSDDPPLWLGPYGGDDFGEGALRPPPPPPPSRPPTSIERDLARVRRECNSLGICPQMG